MKTNLILLTTLALSALGLSSCTTTTTRPAAKRADDGILKRVYTDEDLKRSGRTDTGEALETLDPSIRSTGR